MPVTLADHIRSLREEFRIDLEKNGITLDRLAEDLDKLLQATEVKVFCTKAGELVYSVPMEALSIRLAALREALKLRDLYPAEKSEVKHDGLSDLAEKLLEARKRVASEETPEE